MNPRQTSTPFIIFFAVIVIVAVAVLIASRPDPTRTPPYPPASVVHTICYTDALKEQGKLDELPLVDQGAICRYDVDHAWKAEQK